MFHGTRRAVFLAVSLFILVTDGALFALNTYLSSEALRERFESWAVDQRATHDILLGQTLDTMRLLAYLFASDPRLHPLFLAGREAVLAEGGGAGGERAAALRAELLADLQPAWQVAREEFGMRQLHFHIGPGSLSFLRVHRPQYFGDRMDDLRHIIVDTIADGRARCGFELGRIYSGLRGVVPIYATRAGGTGEALGAVEVGTSYQAVLKSIHAQITGHLAVVLDAAPVNAAMFSAERKRNVLDLEVCGYVLEASTHEEIGELVPALGSDWLEQARGSALDAPKVSRVTLPHPEQGTRVLVAAAWPLESYALGDRRERVGLLLTWQDVSETMADHRRGLIISGLYALLTFLVLEVVLYYAIRLGIGHLERRVSEATDSIRHLAARLRERAETDSLTGLLNRGAFQELAEARLSAVGEPPVPVTVLMLDVDHFKQVNDTFGHGVGDRVLRTLADTLGQAIRPDDLVGRLGGEEFALLLWNSPKAQAVAVAERIRAMVAELSLSFAGQSAPIRPTISLGVAAWRPGEPLETTLQRADARLYRAKHAGRNQVVAD